MVNKIKSVILGHAVGDALGAPVEFSSREELSKAPVTDMEGYGTYDVPAGAWSDDTSMSLATLDTMSRKDWNCFDVMVSFARWLGLGEYTPTGECFDVGGTCLAAIEDFVKRCYSEEKHGFVIPEGVEATDFGQRGERSNGNGSLMRINPFVLFAHFNEQEYFGWMGCVKTGSQLTHAHERSVMACFIYGYCLEFLLKEASKKSLREAIRFTGRDLEHMSEFDHFKRIFADDFESLPEEKIKSTGYVVDTLEAALWCLLTTESYRECVLKAVNLGGDTDTVAAVAGGLAGALYGIEGIPEEWLDTLIKREYIEEVCERAAVTWSK